MGSSPIASTNQPKPTTQPTKTNSSLVEVHFDLLPTQPRIPRVNGMSTELPKLPEGERLWWRVGPPRSGVWGQGAT